MIGSHWSRSVQADVVVISWSERAILIGECTWSDALVYRQTARDLLARTIRLTVADLPGKGVGWWVYPALFVRAGRTPAVRQNLAEAGGLVSDLPTLFSDLAEVG